MNLKSNEMKTFIWPKNLILLIVIACFFTNCSSEDSVNSPSDTSSKYFLPVVNIDYVEIGDGYSTECKNSVEADGHAIVTSRGICWGTNSNPTIQLNNKTIDGSGLGNFTSTITDLQPNTNYYLRAYATNSVGTSYSDAKLFNSGIGDPKLSTISATNIRQTTIVSGGNITNDGGIEITQKGVCWSLNANPTLSYNNRTIDGSGKSSFISSISGLKSGTIYYIRAYAANFTVIPTRIGYGNEIVITTK